MREESINQRSQVPGLGDTAGLGSLFRQRGVVSKKSELVILIKPTIVQGDRTWQQDLTETRDRIRAIQPQVPQFPQLPQPQQ
jgi:MSHA biogenesis protein MshL